MTIICFILALVYVFYTTPCSHEVSPIAGMSLQEMDDSGLDQPRVVHVRAHTRGRPRR